MPTEYTFTCATCDHVIAGRPVFHLGLAFCCAGCAADGPCLCSYDMEPLPAPAVVTLYADADPTEEPAVTEEPVTVAAVVPAVVPAVAPPVAPTVVPARDLVSSSR